jgi:hypothetical protein
LKLVMEVVGLFDPHEGAGLRAFAYSEIARLRADRSDVDGAVEAIEFALAEKLGPRDSQLQQTIEQNRIAALRLAAMTSARRGDYARSMQLIGRLRSEDGEGGHSSADFSDDVKSAVHAAAKQHLDAGHVGQAAEIYREGFRLHPEDPTMLHNLVAVLERGAVAHVESGQCDRSEPILEEISALDPRSDFPQRSRLRCLMLRAKSRLDAHDFSEAVALLEVAVTRPGADDLVSRNLGLALLKWIRFESEAGHCVSARKITARFKASKAYALTKASLPQVLGACRP